MKGRWIFLLATVVLFLGGWSVRTFAELTEGQSFTNEDLEKYRRPSTDEGNTASVNTRDEKRDREKKDVRKDEEYWCKKGSQHRRQIDRSKDEIEEILSRFPEQKNRDLDDVSLPNKSLKKKFETARKKLKEAERDLTDVEQEAHRKGVPAGWVRCQFE